MAPSFLLLSTSLSFLSFCHPIALNKQNDFLFLSVNKVDSEEGAKGTGQGISWGITTAQRSGSQSFVSILL